MPIWVRTLVLVFVVGLVTVGAKIIARFGFQDGIKVNNLASVANFNSNDDESLSSDEITNDNLISFLMIFLQKPKFNQTHNLI